MKKATLIAALSAVGLIATAQPNLTAWKMNTTGDMFSYDAGSGVVNTNDSTDVKKVCYDNDYVYISAESLPSETIGPWPGNPNTPMAQGNIFRIPKNPSAATGPLFSTQGPIGIAIDGVVFYSAGDARSWDGSGNVPNGDGVWNSDAWPSEGSTMDAQANGHADQNGNYHYHANPILHYTDPSSGHSPIIGFAADGYPIYGPFGYDDSLDNMSPVVRMQSSYSLRSITQRNTYYDGSPATPAGPAVSATYPLGTYMEDYGFDQATGHLDEHNGRYCVTPEYPGGTYAYFMATESNGDPAYPYLIGPTYYGNVNMADMGPSWGAATITAGATCLGSTSGVAERDLSFGLFPNPANESVNISTSESGELMIIDLQGKIVSTQSLVTGTNTVDVSELGRGVYVATFTNGGISRTERLVIK